MIALKGAAERASILREAMNQVRETQIQTWQHSQETIDQVALGHYDNVPDYGYEVEVEFHDPD